MIYCHGSVPEIQIVVCDDSTITRLTRQDFGYQPIYQDLNRNKLLQRCGRGFNQNNNSLRQCYHRNRDKHGFTNCHGREASTQERPRDQNVSE